MVGVVARLSRRSNPDFEDLQHDRLAFFQRCSQTADIVSLRAGVDDVLVVSHPSLVNDVLITRLQQGLPHEPHAPAAGGKHVAGRQ